MSLRAHEVIKGKRHSLEWTYRMRKLKETFGIISMQAKVTNTRDVVNKTELVVFVGAKNNKEFAISNNPYVNMENLTSPFKTLTGREILSQILFPFL
jgi:hypothetical protein